MGSLVTTDERGELDRWRDSRPSGKIWCIITSWPYLSLPKLMVYSGEVDRWWGYDSVGVRSSTGFSTALRDDIYPTEDAAYAEVAERYDKWISELVRVRDQHGGRCGRQR